MDAKQQMKYSYLVTAVGVVLMAISAIYGAIRALFVREMFRPNGNFNGNFTRNFNGTFVGNRQFAGGTPFGLTNALTIIAVVIAVVGIVWLGLVLRKSPKSAAN